MNENSVTFFSRYITACFFPSRYRELIEDKKHSIYSYILVLVFVLTMISDVIPFMAWEASVGGLKNLLTEGLPAFSIENGEMKCDQSLSFPLGNVWYVKVDTDQESFSASDVKEKGYVLYFSKTNMIIRSAGVSREIAYSSFGTGVIDNNTLVALLPVFRISMFLSMILLYLFALVEYLLMAAFFSLLSMGMVRDPGGDRLPFKVTFYIVVYARTLFSLIETVGITLGYPMNNLIMELILVCITFSYIFRGQASVLKLDLKK